MEQVKNFDGWGSLFSAYHNKEANKANVVFIDEATFFTPELLDAIWVRDGFTRRVVSCVAEDMVNKGFTIVGDSANIDLAEVNRLNVKGTFYNALCQARHYGGCAIMLGVDDGEDLSMPIKVNSIKGIKFLRVIPKRKIVPLTDKVDTDPQSADYGKPELYEINDGISKAPYKIHKSRLFIIPWLESSPIKSPVQIEGQQVNAIWGTPILSYMYKQIGNLSTFFDSLSNLAQEACIGKYKVSGLSQLFMAGEEKKIMKRMDIINESKSILNAVILDADNNEDYERDTLSFSGMGNVADTFMIGTSGVSGIPVTRLFGRSPAGLDASGESDMKIYYDMIASYQDTMLTALMQRLVFYIDIYKKAILIEDINARREGIRNGKLSGEVKKVRPVTEADIEIKWNPLYQMTEKEQAETYFTNAQADMYYLQNGIISREECRVNRFVGGYNQQMSVETADLPPEDSFFKSKEDPGNGTGKLSSSANSLQKGKKEAGKKMEK